MHRRILPFLLPFVVFVSLAQGYDRPPFNITSGFIADPICGGITETSWWYSQNYVIHEGDIILGTIDEFNDLVINITYTTEDGIVPSPQFQIQPQRKTKRANSVLPGSRSLWPNGVIPYRFANDAVETNFSTPVNEAIEEWISNIPCLTFLKQPNGDDDASAAGLLTIHMIPDQGYCAADLGFNPRGSNMLLDYKGCTRAEILHEFGHTLGLHHEQKRPDAIKKLHFHCDNLMDYPFGLTESEADARCCGRGTGGCCGFACQFTPGYCDYNDQDPLGRGGEFDFESLMLYRRDAFAKEGKFTLDEGPCEHNNPQHLSRGDVRRIRELYGCSNETARRGG
jgi:Astacin (Peptidase family M12A)